MANIRKGGYIYKYEFVGYCNDAYKALELEDFGEVAMAYVDFLKEDTNWKVRVKKDKARSSTYREESNEEFRAKRPLLSLMGYNRALAFAPINSQEMVFALSNRSALLLKLRAFNACLIDIETCFKIGCSSELREKLNKRKEIAIKNLSFQKFHTRIPIIEKLFNDWRATLNPDIPCAKGVDVKIESGQEKVVAAENIDVGTVVALETSFVSHLNADNQFTCCNYCHKPSFNLIPCETCCYALFCNEKCKKLCWDDIHNAECDLMDDPLESYSYDHFQFRLALKAALKIKKSCSWREFIAESKTIGSQRMKESPISEHYDVNKKFSLLNFKEGREPHYGLMYRLSYVCAKFLLRLDEVSYFPKNQNDKLEAMKAFARAIMKLSLTLTSRIPINSPSNDDFIERIVLLPTNLGWFSFASKLKHRCDANLIVAGLNNQIALVAVKTIKKGEELNVSYIDHAYEFAAMPTVSMQKRAIQLYLTANMCQCFACKGIFEDDGNSKKTVLTPQQQAAFRKFTRLNLSHAQVSNIKPLSAIMTSLQAVPFSKEYMKVYESFKKWLIGCQITHCTNVSVSELSCV